jgi:DNA-directed RNA polymerase specialized sigma24 family protein
MTLKYSEDLPLAEIGRIMGKSEGAVKLLVFRGTASVRLRLLELRAEVGGAAVDG